MEFVVAWDGKDTERGMQSFKYWEEIVNGHTMALEYITDEKYEIGMFLLNLDDKPFQPFSSDL